MASDGNYVVQAILGDRVQWELRHDNQSYAVAMAERAMRDSCADLTSVRVLTRDGECVYEDTRGEGPDECSVCARRFTATRRDRLAICRKCRG